MDKFDGYVFLYLVSMSALYSFFAIVVFHLAFPVVMLGSVVFGFLFGVSAIPVMSTLLRRQVG